MATHTQAPPHATQPAKPALRGGAHFGTIARGARHVEVYRVQLDPDASADEAVGMRTLTAIEEADVIAQAREFARQRGSSDPRPGDELYDMAAMAMTLARACVEASPDTPASAADATASSGAPYFPGGHVQILSSLDSDAIAYLYAVWQQHADRFSPRRLRMTAAEMADSLPVLLGEEEGQAALFFSRLRPGMQLRLLRFLGVLYRSAVSTSSGSTSSSSSDASPLSSAPLSTTQHKGEGADLGTGTASMPPDATG